MKKYDVIIVGCGPAGAAAAKVLKDNNINFCIIDKKKFPREKLCGGGLTHKSLTLLKKLGLSYKECNFIKSNEVELIHRNVKSILPLTNELVMIDRIEFDNNNLNQVISNNFYGEEKIVNIEGNTLITDKNTYEFKYIVFADGVNGYSRRLISNREFGFCVEYNSDTKTDKIVFDFCAIDSGYGWIFPKVNHTTIGVGVFMKQKIDYISLLCKFAEKNNIKIEKEKILGYHIPLFSKKIYKQSVLDNKYILVGDAAALIDEVSGEGIYYALYSGMLAAESVIACLNESKNLKEVYYKKSKRMCSSLMKRKFLSKFLYSKCGPFFVKLGLSNKFFIKFLNRVFG